MMIRINDTDFYIGETGRFRLFVQYFKGIPIRWVFDRIEKVLRVCVEDISACKGYESVSEFLGHDKALDDFNRFKKETPYIPLFGEFGSYSFFEKGEILGFTGTWMMWQQYK